MPAVSVSLEDLHSRSDQITDQPALLPVQSAVTESSTVAVQSEAIELNSLVPFMFVALILLIIFLVASLIFCAVCYYK